jgi:hypothetical protein
MSSESLAAFRKSAGDDLAKLAEDHIKHEYDKLQLTKPRFLNETNVFIQVYKNRTARLSNLPQEKFTPMP